MTSLPLCPSDSTLNPMNYSGETPWSSSNVQQRKRAPRDFHQKSPSVQRRGKISTTSVYTARRGCRRRNTTRTLSRANENGSRGSHGRNNVKSFQLRNQNKIVTHFNNPSFFSLFFSISRMAHVGGTTPNDPLHATVAYRKKPPTLAKG